MKSIALIHTVKSVLNTFEETLRRGVSEEVKVHNILDDFLANNSNEIGCFSIENRNRLFMDIKSAQLTGADVIVTTCSTLTPIVDLIRPFIDTPIIAIDDAMAMKGVTYGNKVLIIATAMSTVEPTKSKMKAEANKVGKEVILDSIVCQDAFAAMKCQDMILHDDIIRKKVKDISGYDCIILAQASMAHLDSELSVICGCPVLSSPKLCIEQVNNILKKI